MGNFEETNLSKMHQENASRNSRDSCPTFSASKKKLNCNQGNRAVVLRGSMPAIVHNV